MPEYCKKVSHTEALQGGGGTDAAEWGGCLVGGAEEQRGGEAAQIAVGDGSEGDDWCFKSTRTEVALALAGLPPADLVGKEMVVQYTNGTMRRRMEALREECEWSPHVRFVREKPEMNDLIVRNDA
eukprot:CAMPEP_0206389408 /NCGR_PEP_ID=MMETSP0294-20121207/17925_1 /ASSEMBLY_ACC=CAM_ASM_000327 /TAXON_ID=39354 /ORGANISM="Heterosigma akashiwo, Strain CCMP2393" /LENGTH=125 /DNA_ID=CAMNT_0053841449 /DNA_START=290 /DNA_END=668 /DNA_ORIENTATION=+